MSSSNEALQKRVTSVLEMALSTVGSLAESLFNKEMETMGLGVSHGNKMDVKKADSDEEDEGSDDGILAVIG